jgi:cysteinyl-tRNA synthetase
MDDDFNSAQAVSVLFEMAAELNRGPTPALAAQMRALGGLLGLLQRDPEEFLKGRPACGEPRTLDDAAIDERIVARAAAKARRDFPEADRIRQELLEQGVVLEDAPNGTTWRWR